METRGNTARNEEFYPLFPEWEEVKVWAKRAFSGERIAQIAITGATGAMLGVLFYALCKAMNSYSVTGTGF